MKFFTLVCVVAVVVLARAYNPADPRCKGFDNDMLSTECARSLHRPQDRAEWYYDVDTNLCQVVGRDNNDTCWANFNNTFKDVMICVQTCISSKPILTPNKTKPKDVTEKIVDEMHKTISNGANILFLLDKSYSVDIDDFYLAIKFIKSLIEVFPLSSDLCSGVITYATYSHVDIPLNTTDTCSFMKQADAIRYSGGNTDASTALQTAVNETSHHGIHKQTIVFMLTDGSSQSIPTIAVDYMKSCGDILFMIGIGDYLPEQLIPLASQDKNGIQLFFGIDNFDTFKKITDYLVDNLLKNSNNHVKCA